MESDRSGGESLTGAIPYAIWCCSADVPGGVVTIIVTWVTQLSFTPPLLGVVLESDGAFLQTVLGAGRFVLAALPREGGKEIAKRVLKHGGSVTDPGNPGLFLDDPAWRDVPAGALGAIRCTVEGTFPAGDHTVVVARIGETRRWQEGGALQLADTGWKYQKPTQETTTDTTTT